MRTHDGTPAARRHAAPPLPRVLRAARLDHGRRRPPGQRAARLRQPAAVVRGALQAARDRLLLRPGVRRLPHRALPALPRAPAADAGRARAPVGARAGALRGARLDRRRARVARGRRPDVRLRASARSTAGGNAQILTGDRDMFQCAGDGITILLQQARQEGPTEMGPEEVEERYGIPPADRARLHRAARRPVRRAARREGHRREDGGRPAAPPRLARGGDRRRDPRAAGRAPRADRAGRRAARVQGHRDAARRRRRAPAGPRDRPRGRRGGGRGARDGRSARLGR